MAISIDVPNFHEVEVVYPLLPYPVVEEPYVGFVTGGVPVGWLAQWFLEQNGQVFPR